MRSLSLGCWRNKEEERGKMMEREGENMKGLEGALGRGVMGHEEGNMKEREGGNMEKA